MPEREGECTLLVFRIPSGIAKLDFDAGNFSVESGPKELTWGRVLASWSRSPEMTADEAVAVALRELGLAPRWVTAGLLAETIEVWRPQCQRRLSCFEALEFLSSFGRLGDVLAGVRDYEKGGSSW